MPLILTPVILSAVGKESYGVWAVLLNFGAWVIYLDLGLSLGIPKVAAEIAVREEYEKIWSLIAGVLLVWASGFAIVLGGVWVYSAGIFEKLVGGSASLSHRMLLVSVVAYFGFVLGTRIIGGILNGLQWVAAASKVNMLVSVVQFVLAVWAMKTGHGLLALAGIYGLMSAAQFCFLIALLWRHIKNPGLRVFDFRLLRTVASAGGVLYLIYLLAQIFQLDRIYFALIRIPLDRIADYHLGASLVAKIAGLLGAMTVAIYPAASSFAVLRDDRRLAELAGRGTKYLAVSGFLLFGFLIAFAPEILRLWLGESPPAAVLSARILSMWGVTAVIGGLTSIGAGLGKPGYQLKSSVLALGVGAAFFYGVGRFHGVAGVAWTISVSVFMVAVYYVYDFCRHILPGCGKDLILNSILKPLIASAAAVLPAYGLTAVIHASAGFGQTRAGTAAILLAAAAVAAGVFVPASKLVRLFDEKDLQTIFGSDRAS